MAADLACPSPLWPEPLPCAEGLCDGAGHCICPNGINVGDFTGMFATACFDLRAVQALYILSTLGGLGALVYCADFVLLVSKVRREQNIFGPMLLGGLGIIWSWLSISLGIARAVRPEWVIGQHALPTVLFSLMFIVFWTFTYSVILRIVVLARRISLFALEEQRSQILVRRSQWVYVVHVFTVASNLTPLFMLAAPQSPTAVEGLGICFFLGNALVCFFSGFVALRIILIPLCDMFKKHGASSEVGINAESKKQFTRVAQKMEFFAFYIQYLTIGASLLLFLPTVWPIVLRSSVYVLPINNGACTFVIIACTSLFRPVTKGANQTQDIGTVTSVTSARNLGTGYEDSSRQL